MAVKTAAILGLLFFIIFPPYYGYKLKKKPRPLRAPGKDALYAIGLHSDKIIVTAEKAPGAHLFPIRGLSPRAVSGGTVRPGSVGKAAKFLTVLSKICLCSGFIVRYAAIKRALFSCLVISPSLKSAHLMYNHRSFYEKL
jgi:hypothetical protein